MAAYAEITLKNRLSELERLAAAVAQFTQSRKLPARVAFDVSLAVDEVVTNVIRYAYDEGAEREIVVRIACDDAELTVEVEDDGRAFDPRAVAAPDVASPLSARPIGGLGMHLVRSVMDDLDYARRDDKNVLRMTKRLEARQPAGPDESAGAHIGESRTEDGILILEIGGRLHGPAAEMLEQKLLAAITAGSKGVVLDVAALDYFGSAGLRVLLVAAKRLRTKGCIALVAPKDFIRAVIDVAGLRSIITIHSDRSAALAHVRKMRVYP